MHALHKEHGMKAYVGAAHILPHISSIIFQQIWVKLILEAGLNMGADTGRCCSLVPGYFF